jgi:hypothetical protein
VNSAGQFVQSEAQRFAQPPHMNGAPQARPAVSQNYIRQLFDKIKKGNVEEIVSNIRDNCVDVSLLKDEQNFQQSAMFSACVIKDAA